MKKSSLLTILALFSLFACAQEPAPAVQAIQGFTGVSDLTPTDSITKNALNFEGSDFFGQKCGLSLSIIEENGAHLFLTKVNYKLHGEVLPDTESSLYRFDLGSNSYNDVNSGSGSLTFGAALLNNDSTPDLNQLSSYEANGSLLYSVRVETNATSATDYEEALEKVIDDPTQLAAYSSTLDQISRIVFKINHAGHYDAAGCIGLKLTNVATATFEVGAHDDHDHDDHGDDHDDDDHDDDHDHDHD